MKGATAPLGAIAKYFNFTYLANIGLLSQFDVEFGSEGAAAPFHPLLQGIDAIVGAVGQRLKGLNDMAECV